jgi:LAS superfamily LD-carboxypeptidase LdcB
LCTNNKHNFSGKYNYLCKDKKKILTNQTFSSFFSYLCTTKNSPSKTPYKMKHITLIFTLIVLLACSNHKAQNTTNLTQDSTSTTSTPTQMPNKSELSDKSDSSDKSQLSTEMLLGKFTPAQDTNFVVIPDHMSTYKGLYCEKQTFNAYLAMRDSALQEGITLTIISATRNFDRQRQIWERKWNSYKPQNSSDKSDRPNGLTSPTSPTSSNTSEDIAKIRSIMRFSSMPGTSRHHWGTELDFISAETNYWTHGEGLRIYNWLCANAHKFGFFQPYTANPTRTGYAEERWHWSYAPLSKPYLETYKQKITAEDITGFSGSYLVDSLNIIESHVFGIEY